MSSTPPDAQWTALVTAATLGTARVPPAAELARLGDGATLPEAALPTRMLRAAMAAQLWRTAGERTAADPSSAALAAAAHRSTAASGSLISELACWRLGRMLAGDRRELVGEWLQHANATCAALPVHWRPVALEALRADERKLCSTSLGLDADWLSAENPAWQRAQVTEPSEEHWQTGTLEARDAALRAQRALDPATARAWLESTWEQDPPEARERFLQALEPGLSLADEALLERALDDKRKPVRRAAATLLARLPESALATRMRARLQPLLLLPPAEKKFLGLARKRKLEVQLPTAPDKAAQRDGIEPKPPAGRKIGERSFWLVQMLAVVPPAHWSREFECEPAELLGAAAATDYAADLLVALSEAAVLHPTEPWLRALCDHWLERSDAADPTLRPQHLAALIGAATPELQQALLHQILAAIGKKDFQLAQSLLAGVAISWDSELTREALRLLAVAIRKDTQKWTLPRTLLADWAVRADIDAALPATRELLESLSADSVWRNAVEALLETLEFRHSMKKELLP
jgi:hypothetical protein